MANVIDQLINEGKLPDINMQVEIDQRSVFMLAGGILAALLIAVIFFVFLTKYSKS